MFSRVEVRTELEMGVVIWFDAIRWSWPPISHFSVLVLYFTLLLSFFYKTSKLGSICTHALCYRIDFLAIVVSVS